MTESIEKAIVELKGTALKVFLYTLKQKKDIGIRKPQRDLNLKNVSLAQYHLHRLYTLGLLEKNPENKYRLTAECASLRNLKLNIILEFFIFRNWFVPYVGLFAAFLLSSSVITLLFYFLLSSAAAIFYALGALILTGILAVARSIQIIKTIKSD